MTKSPPLFLFFVGLVSNFIKMSNHQAKLLTELAKKIKSEPKSKAQVLYSMTTAKILTKNGNLTNHYSNLKKVVSESK